MVVYWRKSAIESLLEIDQWWATIELQPISGYLKNIIQTYFKRQNFSIYFPGRQVLVQHMPVDLMMVLIAVGKSDPYKVFYRMKGQRIEIFLVRHPHQKPLT